MEVYDEKLYNKLKESYLEKLLIIGQNACLGTLSSYQKEKIRDTMQEYLEALGPMGAISLLGKKATIQHAASRMARDLLTSDLEISVYREMASEIYEVAGMEYKIF